MGGRTDLKLSDYLIDHSTFKWAELLDAWGWLNLGTVTMWLVNRFAEAIVVREDGSVSYLDTGAGQVKELAQNRDEFLSKIGDDDYANDWLMIPLVDRCVATGMKLGANQCYGFKIPPALGGKYDVDNVEVLDVAVYLALMGQIHRQIRDVPDGAQIRLVVK